MKRNWYNDLTAQPPLLQTGNEAQRQERMCVGLHRCKPGSQKLVLEGTRSPPPTRTPLALHTLCSPWPAFRPPACRWESPDLGDGPLHLWSALPVRKFSCRCKGHVGHRARCPRFYLLLFPPQTSASLCVPRLETPPVPKEGRLQTKATSVKARDRLLPGLQPLFLSL